MRPCSLLFSFLDGKEKRMMTMPRILLVQIKDDGVEERPQAKAF
jgi:hypothetical protein